jgi:hypothetical protein
MIARCENQDGEFYHLYGGRGIRVSERWRNSFETFLADMGMKPSRAFTIDRHPNPDGNYEPGNCRWATRDEQNRNKRTNKRYPYKGSLEILRDIIDISQTKVPRSTIVYRLKRGMAIEMAIQQPSRMP